MGRRRKWSVSLLGGQTAGVLILGILFLAGSAAGCVSAGLLRVEDGQELLNYLNGYSESLRDGGVHAGFWSVLCQTVRFPLMAFLLGLTALGVVGIPVLFAVRGFLLCYAVSVFYRLLGVSGLLPAFCLFGITALLWMPVMFRLGVQGLLGAHGLLRRALGNGRYPLPYNSSYFVSCALCAAALVLCAGLEYLMVPTLLQVVSRSL